MNWKPWPTDSRYLISDEGHVKGLKGYILKPSRCGADYRKVYTSSNPNQRVDYMVLETFVGPRPDGCEVLHANDIQSDNRLENLSWGTHRQNCEDRTRNGKHFKTFKYNHEDIREAWRNGAGRPDIMKKFGVSHVQLWRILGRTRTYARDLK